MELLGKKINISINLNVEKILSTVDYFKERIKNKDYDFEHIITDNRGNNWKSNYDGASYAWGSRFDKEKKEREGYAHMVVIHEHSEDGAWLYGPVIEKICPWVQQLKDKCHGLDFIESGVMQHSTGVMPHIDHSIDNDKPMSRLVTVLYQEDPTAHLVGWRADRDSVDLLRNSQKAREEIEHEKFRLEVGESYILNIKKAHAVYNTKKRLIFTARFNNSVEEIAEYFEKLGPIELG